ncbi:MAG: hypothetical protein NC177_11550 [Ruminococcus flavefaciens]|nr:hypothetical protein [Ruminococcus flavefaciens]
MTRKEFKDIWNIDELAIAPSNAMNYVRAEVKYKDDNLLLNFDLFTEDEVYALGYDFFRQLKEKLSGLDDISKKIITEQELNWNDVELKLSEIRLRKPYYNSEGFYHYFALTYYGGECYDDDDNLIDDSFPDLLSIHVCFDKNFNFVEAFVETEMTD